MTESLCHCYDCDAELQLPDGSVGRSESCSSCGADVRVCRNCEHFDTKCYNECREPQAERVLDKEKGNFCDYFRMASGSRKVESDNKSEQLKRLDSLFK